MHRDRATISDQDITAEAAMVRCENTMQHAKQAIYDTLLTATHDNQKVTIFTYFYRDWTYAIQQWYEHQFHTQLFPNEMNQGGGVL